MFGVSQNKLFSGLPVVSNDPAQQPFTTSPVSEGPDVGFVENWQAKFAEQALAESAYGNSAVMEEKLKERARLIEEKTGEKFGVLYAYPEVADGVEGRQAAPSERAYQRYGRAFMNAKTGYRQDGADEFLARAIEQEKRIESLRKIYPDIPSYRELVNQTNDLIGFVKEDAASKGRRAGIGGDIGGFAGAVQGSFTLNDPFNLATLPFGGFGKTAVARIGTEALTQAGIELFNQYAFVRPEKQAFGREFSNAEALAGTAFAAVGGAAFRGIGEAAPLVSKTLKQYVPEKAQAIAGALDELAKKDSRLGRLAARITQAATRDEAAAALREASAKDISDLLDKVDANPTETPATAKAAAEPEIMAEAAQPRGMAWQEHMQRANEVATAYERGAEMPLLQPTPGNTLGYDLPALRVSDLQVDAQRFQFKEGGDSLGVTERLRGVQEWNPTMAGTISVWESKDGQLFIADGHQRTGLARRLMQNQPDLDIRIPSHVYREIDGITAEMAMVRAAIKNIGEGTGTPIDAAKVFRGADEETLGEMRRVLAPNSQLVQQGRALMNLGDEAFSMVAQGVVPENYAAIVGRLVKGEPQQVAIMRILERVEPDNAFQAEQIVKQAAEDDIDINVTQDLFGERLEAAPLYADKAKVLDLALKQVRKERAALNSLVKNDDIINAVAKVDFDATKAGLDGAGWLQYIMQSQAFKRGTISDLLTAAAREVQNGAKHGTAARSLIKAIKERITATGASSLIGDGEGFASAVKQSFGEIIQRERQDLFAQSVADAEKQATPEFITREYENLAAQAGAAPEPRPDILDPEARAAMQEADAQLATVDPEQELPLGDFTMNAEGEAAQKLVKMKDLMQDIADDDALLKGMQECLL